MKRLKTITILAAVIAGLSVALMAYSAYSIYTIHDWVSTSSERAKVTAGCLWIGFLAHFLLVSWSGIIVSKLPQVRLLGCISLVTGITSTIFFLSDLLGLFEMVEEIPQGYPNESTRILVLLGMLTHLAFFSLLVPTIVRAFQNLALAPPAVSTASAAGMFVSTNVAGTICAAIGFGVMILQSDVAPLTRYQQKMLVLIESLFILAPYILIAATWLWVAYRKPGMMDEKQRSDVSRAGTATWLISVPLMLLMFLAEYRVGWVAVQTIWFPCYLFLTLFVFSVCSLWNYRRS